MKTKKYACEQRYYDDGKVYTLVREARENEHPVHHELENYDVYVDLFYTLEQAKKFAADARKA